MKFNLLDYGYITASGTPSLDVEAVQNILAVTGTTVLSGSMDHNLTIYGDIVDRIGTYQIRYYFDSVTSSGTIASGISFYYKDDDIDPYSILTTNVGDGYYYATVPGLSAPRYIKLNHTVSGTSIVGTVVGLEVLNYDAVVNFGADGTLESSTTLTSLSYLNYNDYIKEIPVFNNGPSTATAHIFLDPQLNDADELLSISALENGPWVFARNTDYIISNADNWNAGQYSGTNTSGIADGKLRLDSDKIIGTYTTPIFKNETVKFAYVDMLQTAVSGSIIAVDSDDYTSTIQIRSSSSKPIDYNVYRVLYYDAVTYSNQLWYKEFLVTTDTEVYDSFDTTNTHFGTPWTYYSSGYTFYHTQFTIDERTQKTAVVMVTFHSNGYYAGVFWIDLILLSQEGVQTNLNLISNGWINTRGANPYMADIKDMKFDSDGGIWLYVYITHTPNSFNTTPSMGNEMSGVGYWLLHLDSSLSVTYNSGAQTTSFIAGAWAPAVGSTSLWYCVPQGTVAVVKLSSTGTIEFSYEDVVNLGGLSATSDGGCWFIDDDKLYKLNSSGILVDSITSLEINDELTFVEFDSEDSDFLWIVDGAYVKRIRLDGSIYSSVYFEGFNIRRLLTTSEGIWVYCTEGTTGDQYAKYIGKTSTGVEKSIVCVTDDGEGDPSDIGIKNVSYGNPTLGDLIPLSDDIVWNDSLLWNKAVTANAVLPREEYNQLKLTLRRTSSNIDSPTVDNIYYQDSVKIIDIPPNQSKTLYLKISIPDGITIGGDYESNLRVWWELPVV